jgi:membrane-bound lytic murein transglycosylase MltF
MISTGNQEPDMKKYAIGMGLAVVLLVVVACGETGPSQHATDANGNESAATSVGPLPGEEDELSNPFSEPSTQAETLLAADDMLLAPRVGDMDSMKEWRGVRILTVYSTGQYYFHKGQEKGFTKDWAVLFEKFLNRNTPRKELKVRAVIVPVARNQLIPALLAGRGDIIIANLSITPQREEVLDFSIPVSKPLSEILVTGPSAPALASIDDLSGQVVHVRLSSSYRESLEALNKRLVSKGKAPVEIEPASEFLEDEDLIEMVNSGLLPWAVIDDYKLLIWKDVFPDLVPRPDIVLRESGQIAWAFRKNSPQLAAEVNAFLKKNRQGTLVGNVLVKRYVTDFDWAKNAFSDEDYARFQQLLAIFKKYGELYEVDHILAAAQGYQESRLNQSARSKSGAIGIMQLLPSTALDHNIAIDNIEKTENNIHAGVKYLSFLRNRYFNDPQIEETNQTLMALAAYNLGPARVIELRNKAKSKGYDPNVWFDNVELAAASHVGREPVQYVANIYKYYVAYRGALKDVSRRNTAREKAGIGEL